MKYLKLIIVFIFFFSNYSFSQTFSLPELIRMSKMDDDSFDTFVSSRKFVFLKEVSDINSNGVTYAFKPNLSGNGQANKFITLYSRYFGNLWHITYQTRDNSEYLKIKNQIRPLGFKFITSRIFNVYNGEQSNWFKYSKGKSTLNLFVYVDGYEINFGVDQQSLSL